MADIAEIEYEFKTTLLDGLLYSCTQGLYRFSTHQPSRHVYQNNRTDLPCLQRKAHSSLQLLTSEIACAYLRQRVATGQMLT